MDYRRTMYGAAVGAVTAGPFGAVVGGLGGFLLEKIISSETGPGNESLSATEKVFLPLLSVLSAASRANGCASAKESARVLAITKQSLSEVDHQHIAYLIVTAQNQNFKPEQCARVFYGIPEDQKLALARDIYSVLLAEGADMGKQRIDWLCKVAEGSGLAADSWLFVEMFYRPVDKPSWRDPALKALGLPKNATQRDIKIAYRALSRDFHPDTLANASAAIVRLAEEKMKELNDAYEILSSDNLRSFFIHQPDNSWISAYEVADEQVMKCYLCTAQNRFKRETIFSSRCGNCYAQLALPKKLVEMLRQPVQ